MELEQQYEQEFFQTKLDYDTFIEANNEEDLKKKLEQEKNDTINERSRLLQSTFNMSLVHAEKKKQLKMTERDDEELDEELKFLMTKIDHADELKLQIEEKLNITRSGRRSYPRILWTYFLELEQIGVSNAELKMSDILDILPGAAKKLDEALPDFLDTKNRTQFERFKKDGIQGIKQKMVVGREHVPFSYNP